ncbi:MarR family winged helix-turn-helix transcriptional regulator [Chloroflexota bacterium]
MDKEKDIRFGLWQLLNRTRQLIYRARANELARYGTTTRRAAILEIVFRLGGKATQPEIARQLFTGRHVISEQLTRMEKDGLIKRFRDPKRKNEVRVEVTEKGNQLQQKVAIRQSIKDAISVLDNEEVLVLWHILAKLRDMGITNLGLTRDSSTVFPPSNPDDYKK